MCFFTVTHAGASLEIAWNILRGDSSDPPVFYLVPDGGQYNESHMISLDPTSGYSMIDDNTLRIINVSSRHEGKYYCVQGGKGVSPTSGISPCLVVKGMLWY